MQTWRQVLLESWFPLVDLVDSERVCNLRSVLDHENFFISTDQIDDGAATRTEVSLRDSRAFVAFSSVSKVTQPVRTQFANGCPSPVDNLSNPSSGEKTYRIEQRDQ